MMSPSTPTSAATSGGSISARALQGAGGVGGLLSVVEPGATTRYYPAYDGNGNVSEYVNQSGTEVAHFEYDPFGNLTVDDQSNASAFPYRFSTKPQDSVTGLYYYGYRYYDPVTGRWPSRDPIGELGGINLYGFVGNDGVSLADFLGLKTLKDGPDKIKITLFGIEILKPSVTFEAVGNGSSTEGPSISGPSITVEGDTEISLGGVFRKFGLAGAKITVSFINLKLVDSKCVDQSGIGKNWHSLVNKYEADIDGFIEKQSPLGSKGTHKNLGKVDFKVTDLGCGACKK